MQVGRVRGDGLCRTRAGADPLRPPAAPASPSPRAPARATSPTRQDSRRRRRRLPALPAPRHLRDLRRAAARVASRRGGGRPLRRPAPAHRRRATALVRPRSSRARAPGRRPTASPRSIADADPLRASHQQPRLLRDLGAAAPASRSSREARSTRTTWSWTRRAAPPAPAARRARTCSSPRSRTTSRPTRPAASHRHVGEMEAVVREQATGRDDAPHLLPAPPARAARHPVRALPEDDRRRGRAARGVLRAGLRGRALRARGGRRPAAPLRRRPHQRVPDVRARRRPGPGGRLLRPRQPREGRGRPGRAEPEPRPRACPKTTGSCAGARDAAARVQARRARARGSGPRSPPLAEELRRGARPPCCRARRRPLRRAGCSRRCGLESRFVDGRRSTSPEAMEVVEMVLSGVVNKALAAGLTAAGLPAVGLSGRDAGLLRARVQPGLGRVGVPGGGGHARPASGLGRRACVPVVSPVSQGADGGALNVNADEAALALAVALRRGGPRLSFRRGRRAAGRRHRRVAQRGRGRAATSREGAITGGMAMKVRHRAAGRGARACRR